MSTHVRSADTSVISDLEQHPASYEFFQAIRILLKAYPSHPQSALRLLGEKVRFSAPTALAFPQAEIDRMYKKQQEVNDPAAASMSQLSLSVHQPAPVQALPEYTLVPNVIGLTGPLGALPNVYSQYLQDQSSRHRKEDARAFLDLFNNRLVSLFVRSHFEFNPGQAYEMDKRPRYADTIHALTLRAEHQVFKPDQHESTSLQSNTFLLPEEFLLAYSGLFRQRMLSGQSLQQMLAGFLQVPVEVQQFVPEWFQLHEDETTVLGRQNSVLGSTMFVGERTRQVSSRVDILIGPVRRDTYQSLLPGGDLYQALRHLLAQVCSPAISVVLRPILHKSDVTPLQLGRSDTRLGQQTFIMTETSSAHRQELELGCHWLAA